MITLKALGGEVSVEGRGEQAAAHEVMRLERLLTRFCPSPLTRLNEEGELHRPPPELVDALDHALQVAAWTNGLVTPAVLPALEAAGYAAALGDLRGTPSPVPDTSDVICGPDLIRLPPGMRLDLGGTAKSWIVERAFQWLSGDGFVNAGGDLLTRQSSPAAIELVKPFGGAPLYLECPAGTWGVATSSVLKRAWAGGHHLIDPRTARPLHSPLVQVTVITRRVTRAEVLTKLAFLDGPVPDPGDDVTLRFAFDTAGQFLRWAPTGWEPAE